MSGWEANFSHQVLTVSLCMSAMDSRGPVVHQEKLNMPSDNAKRELVCDVKGTRQNVDAMSWEKNVLTSQYSLTLPRKNVGVNVSSPLR